MRKPLTPQKHAIVDYVFLAANLTGPALVGASPRAKVLFASFGAVQGSLNAFTDQPLAIKRLIPFKVHGLIEKYSGPAYVALPLLLGVHRNPRDRALWLGMGAALITAYNLTDWNATNTNR